MNQSMPKDIGFFKKFQRRYLRTLNHNLMRNENGRRDSVLLDVLLDSRNFFHFIFCISQTKLRLILDKRLRIVLYQKARLGVTMLKNRNCWEIPTNLLLVDKRFYRNQEKNKIMLPGRGFK